MSIGRALHRTLVILLSLGASGLLIAGVVDRYGVPVYWRSGAHPDYHRPTLHVGFRHLLRPHVIYLRKAPVGGPNVAPRFWFRAGIWISIDKYNYGARVYDIHCPLWMPVALLATYPLIVLIRSPARRRRYRRKRGLCIQCGYDLTGNTSGRCPECAKEIAG